MRARHVIGSFDVVISGGGLAGLTSAVMLAHAGKRVALLERRGTLGWELGRARRLFVDLERWSYLSSSIDELHHRLKRERAYENGVIRAPLAEFALDAWLMDVGVQPLFFTWPTSVESRTGRVEGVTIATKAGYQRILAPCVIETDDHGRLVRHRSEENTGDLHVRSLTLIGLEGEAAAKVGAVNQGLADAFGSYTISVRLTLDGQAQIDIGFSEATYPERELALTRLVPEIMTALRRFAGWEEAALAYIADDEWSQPPIRVATQAHDGPEVGRLVGSEGEAQIPVHATDLIASEPSGLFLAGPWLAPALAASTTEELAIINRILLGELVSEVVLQHHDLNAFTEGGR